MEVKRLITLLVAITGVVNAEPIEYQFIAANGEHTARPITDEYLNPVSDFSMLASGGLSRLLSLKVFAENGSLIQDTTTDLITVSDQITDSNGRDFYGKQIPINNLAEGQYRYEKRLLDRDGSEVSLDKGVFHIDVTKPRFGSWSYSPDEGKGPLSGLPVVNGNNYLMMSLDSISDNVEISHIQARGYKDGELSGDIEIVPNAEGIASLQDELFTLGAGEYEIVFDIYDKAGNSARSTTKVLDTKTAAKPFEIAAIHDPTHPDAGKHSFTFPDANQYVKYEPNMTIYSNPVDIYARIPKEDHRAYNDLGLGYMYYCHQNTCMSDSAYHVIGNDVFVRSNVPHSIINGQNRWRHSNIGKFSQFGDAYLNLHNSVPEGPKYTERTSVYSAARGEYSFHRIITEPGFKFEKVKVQYEPRNVNQRIQLRLPQMSSTSSNGMAYATHTYTAAPGTTQMIIDVPHKVSWEEYCANSIGKPNEAWRMNVQAFIFIDTPQGATLEGQRSDSAFDFDCSPPVLLDYYYDEHTFTLETQELSTVMIGGTAHSDDWRVVAADSYVMLHGEEGQSYRLNLKEEKINTHYFRDFIYDFSDVPEGNYTQATLLLKDYFHNETKRDVNVDVVVDNTPPAISMALDDGDFENGQTVVGLEKLTLHISDLNYPNIREILLQGGPANDLVYLDWNPVSQSQTDYEAKLEYPLIFPGVEVGETYFLTVTATDRFGNESEASYQFGYLPNNLVKINAIEMVPTSDLLLTSENDPLIFIESNELRTNDGSLASGVQELLFTLRSDAPYPVYVMNKSLYVEPGETVNLNYDIDDSTGKLFIPIFPAVDHVEGIAEFMLSLPVIR